MSTTSSVDGIYTRGVAQPNLCYSNGCSWQLVNGVNTWVCCCSGYLCNTAALNTKANLIVFYSILITSFMCFKRF